MTQPLSPLLIAAFVAIILHKAWAEETPGGTCEPCTIFTNSGQWLQLNETIEKYIWEIQRISAIVFRLRGLSVNSSSLESSEIYDPSYWVWGREGNDAFFSMPPLTMDVISLHTLTLTVQNFDLQVESSPPGCTARLNMECLTVRLAEMLVQLLSPIRSELFRDVKGATKSDVVCVSSYLSADSLAVSWRCLRLTREHVRELRSSKGSEVYRLMANTAELRVALSALLMALLLPVIPVIKCLMITFGCSRSCRSQNMQDEQLIECEISGESTEKRGGDQCRQDIAKSGLEHEMRRVVDKASEIKSKLLYALFRLAGRKRNTECITEESNESNLENCEYFELTKTGDSTDCKHWLVVQPRTLVDHKSPAPYLRLLQESLLSERACWGGLAYLFSCLLELLLRVAPFVGEIACVIYWMCSYSSVSDRFVNLNTDARVFYNLLNTPFALFYTKSTLAYVMACFAIGEHIIFVILVFLPSVIHSLLPKKGRKFEQFCRRAMELNLDYPERLLPSLIWVLEYINLFVLIASLCSTLLFLLVGLIMNIKITAPLLTGLFSVVYYLGVFSHGVTDRYTQLKRLMFKFVTDSKNVKWKGVKCEKPADGTIQTVELSGVVLFDRKTWRNNLLFQELLDISMALCPLTERLWNSSIRLFMRMQFITLIVFVMLSFRSSLYQDSMSIVIATIVSLLSSMIPKFTEMFTGMEARKLKEAALESQVVDYLSDANRKYKYNVLVSSDCNCTTFQICDDSILRSIGNEFKKQYSYKESVDDESTESSPFVGSISQATNSAVNCH